MKHMIRKVSILAAALMIMAVPVLAEEGAVRSMMDSSQSAGKDECLLVARNCGNETDSIQQRIDRIHKEIGRGSAVYTNEELKQLYQQLDDANKLLEYIEVNGA